MKQEDWVIYALRLRHDDEYRYVGQTAYGAEYRLKGHLDECKRGVTPLSKWLRKYPDQVVVDVIERCPSGDVKFMDFREQFWIATFRDQYVSGLRKKILLNIMDGGRTQRTWRWTEEQRKRVSERVCGEGNPMYGRRGELAPAYGRTGEKHPMFGKHHTDESKAKISASTKGVPKSEATRARQTEANRKRAASGKMREDSQRAMHSRWHVKRDMIKPECQFCRDENK